MIRRWFYYGFESTPQHRAHSTQAAPSGRDFDCDAGTMPDLNRLSVAAVMGGDYMSLQVKLLQSRPVDIDVATSGQLLQHVLSGTVVLSSKHLRYDCRRMHPVPFPC
jgi:superfamily II DNA/RNA helicase